MPSPSALTRSRSLQSISKWSLLTLTTATLWACGSLMPTPKEQGNVLPHSGTPVSPARIEAKTQTPIEQTSSRNNQLPPADGQSYQDRQDARELARDIATQTGLDANWVWHSLASAEYKAQAARFMMPAPAGTAKNWALYRSRFVEPIRIRAGAQFWQQYAQDLARAEQQYGVPKEIIVGVIGVETIYGQQKGNFRVLDALATLSLDFPKGRSDRTPFFRQELQAFLQFCHAQKIDPTEPLGSFAGAIGWPQFMPSSILKWGVDFDGDGHIDLQNNPVDAIGSVANYLAVHGWMPGEPARFSVTPPADDTQLATLLAPDIRTTFTYQAMTELGAKLPAAAQKHPGLLALVMLENAGKSPTYVAGTQNFYAITRYNQSSYYALAVVELGEAIKSKITP